MTNAETALVWRKRMKLSRRALSDLSGYSASSIQEFEEGTRRGKSGTQANISDMAYKRYMLALEALSARLALK
jgi:hypothetical protein